MAKFDETTGSYLPVTRTANIIMRSGTKPALANVWEGRIIEKLKSYVRDGDIAFKEHSFMFGELDGKRLGKKNYIDIAKAGTKLAQTVFVIIEGKRVTNIPVFKRIITEDGIVTAQFNEAMKPYLLQLRACGIWTSLNYSDYRQLSSIYAQHIYTLLRSWENSNNAEQWDYHFGCSLDDLHQKCGTAKKYPYYKDFRIYVLEVAQRELHRKLGYDFWFMPFKKIRKVFRVEFFYKYSAYKKMMDTVYPNAKKIQSENLD